VGAIVNGDDLTTASRADGMDEDGEEGSANSDEGDMPPPKIQVNLKATNS